MIKLSLSLVHKALELVDLIKYKIIDDKKIEEKATKILTIAKGIEGFVGNGWSSEEQMLKRVAEELKSNRTAVIIYTFMSLLLFPIFSIFMGMATASFNCLGMFIFAYCFYSIFTVTGIISILRMK